MNDHPQAEACASDSSAHTETGAPATERGGETLYEQVARVLPRLSAIGTSLALIAPIILESADSYGRGVRGC